jgi:hypothetical protein
MAPAYGVPRMLVRNGLTYADIDLWEIHEAFAAQLLFHIKAWQDPAFLRDKAGVTADLGAFPVDRVNPNGGSTALGHPFGATGARILSQAVKELAAVPRARAPSSASAPTAARARWPCWKACPAGRAWLPSASSDSFRESSVGGAAGQPPRAWRPLRTWPRPASGRR